MKPDSAEIVQRILSGERLQTVAADFGVGISTISRIVYKECARRNPDFPRQHPRQFMSLSLLRAYAAEFGVAVSAKPLTPRDMVLVHAFVQGANYHTLATIFRLTREGVCWVLHQILWLQENPPMAQRMRQHHGYTRLKPRILRQRLAQLVDMEPR